MCEAHRKQLVYIRLIPSAWYQRSYNKKLHQMNSRISLNHIRLQALHARYVVHFVVFKKKEKSTQMRLSCSAQAKSLRQTAILYGTKILAYERPFYMKRRSESVVKQCICIMRAKLRVKDAFLALRRLHGSANVQLSQKRRSVNTSLPYKIRSFK
jgi:hypothetical protein